MHRIHQEGTLLEVECVKTHRSNKEKLEITFFERLATEGDEKAHELEQQGQCSSAEKT